MAGPGGYLPVRWAQGIRRLATDWIAVPPQVDPPVWQELLESHDQIIDAAVGKHRRVEHAELRSVGEECAGQAFLVDEPVEGDSGDQAAL